MSESIQPFLLAMAIILVPTCVKLGVNALKKKMDEGRSLAADNAAEIKKVLAEHQAKQEAIALERHKDNVERFNRIEEQTTQTNGRVAEHDRKLTIVTAKQEVLMEMMLGRQPDRGN